MIILDLSSIEITKRLESHEFPFLFHSVDEVFAEIRLVPPIPGRRRDDFHLDGSSESWGLAHLILGLGGFGVSFDVIFVFRGL